jgi:hypothetical protein
MVKDKYGALFVVEGEDERGRLGGWRLGDSRGLEIG